jgi:hypothetical protein
MTDVRKDPDISYLQIVLTPRDRGRLETVARDNGLSGPMWARYQLLQAIKGAEIPQVSAVPFDVAEARR